MSNTTVESSSVLASASAQQSLTPAQLGIWLGQQRLGRSGLYNAAEVLWFEGELNINLFSRAISYVFGQAEGLHQRFVLMGERPVQEGHYSPEYCSAEIVDLSKQGLSLNKTREIMLSEARLDQSKWFDLAEQVPFKNIVYKLSNKHTAWYMRIHHIACDGYGFALLSQKVVDVYNAWHQQAKPTANKNGAKQVANSNKVFGDYSKVVHEELGYVTSDRHVKAEKFWQDYLENVPTPISLAERDAPYDCLPTKAEAIIQREALNQLKKLALQLGATWPEIIYALVAAQLFRKTGAAEIVLGLPVMNRLGRASINVPAMVMNIIPLRISIARGGSLKNIIATVQAQIKQTRPHQQYRYEDIRASRQANNLSGRVYRAVVNVMPFDRPLTMPNCSVTTQTLAAGPVEDLAFSAVALSDGGLRLALEGNAHLYSEPALQALLSELSKTFCELCENVENQTSEQHLLAEQVIDINNLSLIRGDALPFVPSSVLHLFLQQVEANPNHAALVSGAVELSYQQLANKIAVAAFGLADSGVNEGAVVAIELPRGIEAIITSFACLMLNACYVFIDPNGPQARNVRIVSDAAPTLIVCDDEQVEIVDVKANSDKNENTATRYGIRAACYTSLLQHNQPAPDYINTLCSQVDADASAYMVYTSGSTGNPKGVIISNRALAEFVCSAISRYNITSADRVLHFAPLHFDASVEEIFCSLCAGASLVIRSEEMAQSFEMFERECNQQKISVLDLPTAFWHEWVSYRENQNSVCSTSELPQAIRTVIIGGEAVLPAKLALWHKTKGQSRAVLLNTYGPSEATVVATVAALNTNDVHIGTPLAGRAIAVVNSEGRCVVRGAEGELWLLGAGLGLGYKNLPELSVEKFITATHLQGLLQEPLPAYRTGDKVKINSDGQIEFIGRLDDTVKISGQLVNPLELENVLLNHAAINEVAVVVDKSEQRVALYAFVVLGENAIEHLAHKQLRDYIRDNLPAVMMPSSIELCESLPKTTAGKIDKKRLLAAASAAPKHQSDMPSDAYLSEQNLNSNQRLNRYQLAVLSVWRDVLGRSDIALHDDFFELGGQSLQVLQIANRLTKQLNGVITSPLPADMLFRHSVANELANAIAQLDASDTAISAKPVGNEIPREVSEDIALSDAFLNEINSAIAAITSSNTSSNKNIFLTGATGFVGAQLLNTLLAESDGKIFCLLRADSQEQAQRKLVDAMLKQDCWRSDYASRVIPVLGDLEKSDFGLPQSVLSEITQSVSCVIHNAANTSVVRDYNAMRKANTLSTKQALLLAVRAKASFHLVSTVAVLDFSSSNKMAGEQQEVAVSWHQGLRDGYQQSKWAAEAIVAHAQQIGYPAAIYRLGRVVGEPRTGYVNANDLAWLIIAASVRLGVFPILDVSEPWTSVDNVARVIARASLKRKPIEPIVHITPNHPQSFAQLFKRLKNVGYLLPSVTMPEWLGRLAESTHPADNALLAFFTMQQPSSVKGGAIGIANRNCKYLVAKLNLDESLLSNEKVDSNFAKYISFAQSAGIISKPSAGHARVSTAAPSVTKHIENAAVDEGACYGV